MLPIDQASFLHHPARRHSSISHYAPPPPAPCLLPLSSSASPPLVYGAVSSSPLPNDPTEPTCEENKRSAHNALERQRREGLNSKFQQLAHALPGLQNIRRPSKSMVVGKSLEFVTRSVQRDSYYKNKIRQLRKEHDTLRKHTQRSQQYLKRRMNETEQEENNQQKIIIRNKSNFTAVASTSRRASSSSNSSSSINNGNGIAATTTIVADATVDNDGDNRTKKSSLNQQKQQTPDVPAIKRHKSRSSSLLASAKKVTTTSSNTKVLHKFVHHHTSSSNPHEKSTPSSARQHNLTKSTRMSPITTVSTNTNAAATENIDPAIVVMTPQQQSRHTPPTTHSVAPSSTSMFPIQVSWPPLDLSALQPPAPDEGLALYASGDIYGSLGHASATTMAFGSEPNLSPQTCPTITTVTATSIPCNIPTYIVPSTYSNCSHPDPHVWK